MMTSPDTAAELLRSVIVADFARLAVAVISIALGIGSILVQWMRRKTHELLRLWFGLLALLYGYRTLLMTQSAGYFLSERAMRFQIGLITFTIGIPAILFGWGLVAKKHNRVTRSLLVINGLMALAFLALHDSERAVGMLYVLNNVLVITFTVAIIAYLFIANREQVPDLHRLRIVISIWGLFVIYNNLRSFLPNAGGDFEFIGFGIFLCSLGYLVASRSLQTEDALASIRKELEIARQIQSSILPEKMPEIAGLSVTAQYTPMSQVAGDFYDFLQTDDRRLGILIADVSGHGVPAALVASMVKVAIAAQAEHADDPARVIAGLNSILVDKLQGQFVTAAYLFLDIDKGTARYSAAGHPPLMHYVSARSEVEQITENGLILGVMPFASYDSKSFQVAQGDRFLLYTDGVLEAARNGEEFGPDRVKRVLSTSPSTQHTCTSLARELVQWSGENAGDDITIVAVEIG